MAETKNKTAAATASENEHSFSALDMSWLSEEIMDAALQTDNLKLKDVAQFHDSLRAAEDTGFMTHETSEKLHHKIDETTNALVERLVAHETVRVCKRLGLYEIMKTHKRWDQLQCMADMQSVGAYTSVCDFEGLSEKDLQRALEEFYAYVANHKSDSRRTAVTLEFPFSKPGEVAELDENEQARPIVKKSVAKKICKQYRKLYSTMVTKEVGGYSSAFVQKLQYTPEELEEMTGVQLKEEDKKNTASTSN